MKKILLSICLSSIGISASAQTLQTPYSSQISPQRLPNNQARLRVPGGGFMGLQLQNSNITNWAGQMASETAVLQTVIARTPILPAIKIQLNNAAALAVKETVECQRLAAANSRREITYRAHQEADLAVTNLVNMIQRGNVISRDIAQCVSRIQYADEQLEHAFGNFNLNDDLAWRTRVARLADVLSDQAGELRALATDTLTGYDRNVDRAIRSYAFGTAQLEQNILAGANRDKITVDFAELDRRWQNLIVNLTSSLSANPGVRAQAARVDELHRQLAVIVNGNNAAAQLPGLVPGLGIVTRGSAFAIGAGEGGGPHVKVVTDLQTNQFVDFYAYDVNFRGGVRVAMADLTNDGIPDIITAPGPGHPPLIRVYDGRNLSLAVEFMAYDPKMISGVHIAAADVNRTGKAIIATGADVGGTPHVRVFDLIAGKVTDQFFPYAENFRGGVRVAMGDVNGDGIPDLITAPGPSQPNSEPTGPTVRVFDGRNRASIVDFNAYDPRWTSGVWLATGDIVRNGRAEIITGADAGGGPHVRVFDGLRGQFLADFFPYPTEFNGGVRVAAHDFNNDGVLDFLCAPGPCSTLIAPAIRVIDGKTRQPLTEFRAFDATFRGGVFVGAR